MRYYFSWELTERTSGMLKGEKFWNPEGRRLIGSGSATLHAGSPA